MVAKAEKTEFVTLQTREGEELPVRVRRDGAAFILEAEAAAKPALSSTGKSRLLVNTRGFQSFGDGVSISLTIIEKAKGGQARRPKLE